MEYGELTEQVIGAAMRVHGRLGPGFLESVYRNALAHELRKLGLEVECGRRIRVLYDGVVVGDFICDLLVEHVVLVETKAILKLAAPHEAQLLNYLTATGIEVGLLLNFGAARLDYKRKTRTYRPSTKLARQDGQDVQDGQDEEPGL